MNNNKTMTHSKYWTELNKLLDISFPKGDCQERGRALFLVANIDMLLSENHFTDVSKMVDPDQPMELKDKDGNKIYTNMSNQDYINMTLDRVLAKAIESQDDWIHHEGSGHRKDKTCDKCQPQEARGECQHYLRADKDGECADCGKHVKPLEECKHSWRIESNMTIPYKYCSKCNMSLTDISKPLSSEPNQVVKEKFTTHKCPYYNDDCPKCKPSQEIDNKTSYSVFPNNSTVKHSSLCPSSNGYTDCCCTSPIKSEPLQAESWKEEFYSLMKSIYPHISGGYIQVENFVSTLLTKARSEGKEAYKAQLQKAVSEIEKNKQSLPKSKCLNAESHLFGSCFNCEKIKGGNEAIDTALEILKKLTD